MKVLGQIQRQAQPVAVLQLHSCLPLFQPAGFALPPLRPDIAEVDGVAHQIAGRIVLREDIGDLRQAAVHIHRYALLDSLRMQRIQRQEQLVRQFGIRVLAVVGKSDPDALAVVAADQPDPDGVVACRRKVRCGYTLRKRPVGGHALHIMAPDKAACAAGSIGRPHGLRGQIIPGFRPGNMDVLHDKGP